MSLNPVPSSLKSSVGSKSTNAHLGGGGGGDEADVFYHHDERSRALYSSWISRLHLRLLPLPPAAPPPHARRKLPLNAEAAAAGVYDGGGVFSHNNDNNINKHTISTDESRTPTSMSNLNSSFVVRRYLNPFERRPAGVPRPRSHQRSVSGFGPFQISSRHLALPRGGKASLGRGIDGNDRVLGRGDYGEGGCFPLFRRMARLGEDLLGEREMLGPRVGRQLESVNGEEQLDQGNARFPLRKAPDAHNQVKLSPFFQFRPSSNSGYSIDRNKGIVGLRIGEGSSKILEHRSRIRPAGSENWRSPLPVSYFPSQEVVEDFPSWRPYDQHFSVDPWHASTSSAHHVARSRGTAYHDGADDAAPVRTFCDPHVLHQNIAANQNDRTPVCMNEAEEPFSLWNMGRFKRRNTVSAISPTIELTSNLSMKRSANFDDSLPVKFRQLGNED